MDAQTVISTTMGIVQQITTMLTPAAKASYEAAAVGARMIALSNLTSDIGWLMFGVICILCSLGALMLACSARPTWDRSDREFVTTISSVASVFLLGVGTVVLCGNIGDLIFNWILFEHQDAALAYTIMNKITGGVAQ